MALYFLNIYSDLFHFTKESEITNYADDNSPYTYIESIESSRSSKFEEDSQNALKVNILSSHDENLSFIVDQYKIYNGKHEKLLGVIIDNNLNFEEHVSRLTLHALARVSIHTGADPGFLLTGMVRCIMHIPEAPMMEAKWRGGGGGGVEGKN